LRRCPLGSRMPALAVVLLGWASIVGAAESTAKTTLVVKGMTCGGCGEEKAEAAANDSTVRRLDIAELRDWFNRSSDSVRVVSLLSPT